MFRKREEEEEGGKENNEISSLCLKLVASLSLSSFSLSSLTRQLPYDPSYFGAFPCSSCSTVPFLPRTCATSSAQWLYSCSCCLRCLRAAGRNGATLKSGSSQGFSREP